METQLKKGKSAISSAPDRPRCWAACMAPPTSGRSRPQHHIFYWPAGSKGAPIIILLLKNIKSCPPEGGGAASRALRARTLPALPPTLSLREGGGGKSGCIPSPSGRGDAAGSAGGVKFK
uniref:Uncharacterized protein n=1 Tax=Morchella importuna TaxID=1174673 RepID=A0A650AG81_9PEZI|nr:hypothetical protein [Morchella importuna]QGN66699.1 hypothetical protein [Morchella importuna]